MPWLWSRLMARTLSRVARGLPRQLRVAVVLVASQAAFAELRDGGGLDVVLEAAAAAAHPDGAYCEHAALAQVANLVEPGLEDVEGFDRVRHEPAHALRADVG